jgi:hypothetical protein
MKLYEVLALLVVTLRYSRGRLSEKILEPRQEGDCSRFVYEYKLLEKLITLETEYAKLQQRIADLEKTRKNTTNVSVHVRLAKTTLLRGTERVKYDVEIYNTGGAYDLKNGLFEAPVPGLYLIHVQVCLGVSNQWIDLNIVKDGAVVGRVFSGDHNYHSCGSEALNLHLQQDDTVWVAREAGTATSLNQDHGWNSFKAILIQED